ncbi:hypothetical protein M409DRAFT_38156 [Zasmidium cellare ATCC 36951]|uniref:Uncharacterized protein n=1 Tax=Zasmidium cellare ATCC 36951 TaxID=1080233 RepID=A0A6A6BVQ7_ZASCE|nr:uncharacterized protein M409DRAFT_38156 [Zasmidium cellare ATCC 36951]KAF2158623.1 hypothetical protein M409DRAFT_38156 [Zasmidium cellare ATCC 36951]
MENETRTAIRHYIGRLCAPRRAARVLTYAAMSYPHFFCDFMLEREDSTAISHRPGPYGGLTIAGICGRMFPSQSSDLKEFQEALQILDDKRSLMSRILEFYTGKDWQPRVHAELTLLEALHDNGCKFFNDDKYIACSKPACFCCYHYICNHPGAFTRPPCHNKVYPNWQPPALAKSTGEVGALRQRDIMLRLTQEVRNAVMRKVLDTHKSMRWHPDSSTGITSLIAKEAAPGGPNDILTMPESSGTVSPQLLATSSSGEESEDGGVALD